MKTSTTPIGALFVAVILLAITGCTNEQGLSLIGGEDAEPGNKVITLTEDQMMVYQNGVRDAIPNPDSAKFVSVKAMELKGQPGLHICGHVRYDDAAATPTEAPFYAELREEEGKPTLHRGQVGEDEAKRAKVDFVCRNHKSS